MADYFTSFSFIVKLANHQQLQASLALAQQVASYRNGQTPLSQIPPPLQHVADYWFFDSDPGRQAHELWLHSQEGGLDAVCAFAQYILAQYNPQDRVGFQWSTDCSHPRTDAYGGGAALITAQAITTFSTAQWLEEEIRLFDLSQKQNLHSHL